MIDNVKVSKEYDGKQRKLFRKLCSCGNEIWAPLHRLERRTHCSTNCPNKINQTLYSELTCSLCGVVFKRLTSKLKASKSGLHFCTRYCKDVGQRISSNLPEIQPNHYSTELKEYRKKVNLECCQGCGYSFSPLLVVHHKDGNRENNSVDNLETVCPNCHALRHMMKTSNGWMYSGKALTPRNELTGFGNA